MSMAIKYNMMKKSKMARGGKMCADGCDMLHEHHYAEGGDVDDDYVEPSPSTESKPVEPSPSTESKPLDYEGSEENKGSSSQTFHNKLRRPTTATTGYAEGGFIDKEKASGYRPMPNEPRKPNSAAMTESDRDLGQHGEYEVAADGMDEDNEASPHGLVAHPVENQDHDAVALDMVGKIMKQRAMHYSKGGRVANDVGMGARADLEDNQFDDLVNRDDLEEHYTGANSGDEDGNAGEDERRMDVISQIMRSRRKKDRLPNPR